MLTMKYQLVVQLSEEIYGNLDWLTELEDRLDESIVGAEVDGHDMGGGEVNIFIHTNNPVNSLQITKDILEEACVELNNIKAAYRVFSEEHYIPLWPENLVEFKII